MNPRVKGRWVKALRSGEWHQTREVLKAEEGEGAYSYCCLGVLCELQGREIGSEPEHEDNTLSPSECAWWGLSEEEVNTLITMNDSGKKSFAEIADYIEANL